MINSTCSMDVAILQMHLYENPKNVNGFFIAIHVRSRIEKNWWDDNPILLFFFLDPSVAGGTKKEPKNQVYKIFLRHRSPPPLQQFELSPKADFKHEFLFNATAFPAYPGKDFKDAVKTRGCAIFLLPCILASTEPTASPARPRG